MEVSKETYSRLNLIIGCSLVIEYLDQLKHTQVYRQGIKHHAKGLSEELEKLLKTDLSKVYSQDEDICVALMKEFENIVKHISTVRPDELMLISQLITAYKQDPEGFNKRNDIVIDKLDGAGA